MNGTMNEIIVESYEIEEGKYDCSEQTAKLYQDENTETLYKLKIVEKEVCLN